MTDHVEAHDDASFVLLDSYGYELDRFESRVEAERHLYNWGEADEVQTVEEYSDEDNDTSPMNYDFISNGDEAQSDNQQFDSEFNWGYGQHTTATEDEQDALATLSSGLDEDVDGDLLDVLQDAQELAQGTSLSDFECSHPDCGLSHGHGPNKHDIRDSPNASGIPGFNITDEFAEGMEFVSNCHCGANEAAMLVQFFPYISIPMFKDQHEFEGVLELEPDVLNAVYRVYNEDDVSVSRAATRVANRRGAVESELVPLGVREDLKQFFGRRQQMEQQAQKAPIGQETRNVIEENREALEEQVA